MVKSYNKFTEEQQDALWEESHSGRAKNLKALMNFFTEKYPNDRVPSYASFSRLLKRRQLNSCNLDSVKIEKRRRNGQYPVS